MGRSWLRSLCICTTRPVTVICTGYADVFIFRLVGISCESTATTRESGLRFCRILRLRIAPSAGRHNMTASSNRHIRSVDVILMRAFSSYKRQNYIFSRKRTNNRTRKSHNYSTIETIGTISPLKVKQRQSRKRHMRCSITKGMCARRNGNLHPKGAKPCWDKRKENWEQHHLVNLPALCFIGIRYTYLIKTFLIVPSPMRMMLMPLFTDALRCPVIP